jgi:hypothetical protein
MGIFNKAEAALLFAIFSASGFHVRGGPVLIEDYFFT